MLNQMDRFQQKPHFKKISEARTKLDGSPAITVAFQYDYLGNVEYTVGVQQLIMVRGGKLYLIHLETPEPEPIYTFSHTITREVAYNLMLFSQRQKLHRAVAEWHETAHSADLSPFYQLLAYHWSKTEDTSRAIYYLERSGEQALRTGVYREAINFLSEALKMAEAWERGEALAGRARTRSGPEPEEMLFLRQAAWERQIGEARYGLGQLAESRVYLQRALTRLGHPLPTTKQQLVLNLAWEVLRQAVHLVGSARARGKRPPDSQGIGVTLEAARAYLQLSLIATFYAEVISDNCK